MLVLLAKTSVYRDRKVPVCTVFATFEVHYCMCHAKAAVDHQQPTSKLTLLTPERNTTASIRVSDSYRIRDLSCRYSILSYVQIV
jgi:hypothetical protein